MVDTNSIDGKRKCAYDRDPETLYRKLKKREKPKEKTFGEIAEEWHDVHWKEISAGTQANYNAPYALMLD